MGVFYGAGHVLMLWRDAYDRYDYSDCVVGNVEMGWHATTKEVEPAKHAYAGISLFRARATLIHNNETDILLRFRPSKAQVSGLMKEDRKGTVKHMTEEGLVSLFDCEPSEDESGNKVLQVQIVIVIQQNLEETT